MRRKVNLQGFAPVASRWAVTDRLDAAVRRAGGYVEDVHFFSDLSTNLFVVCGLKQFAPLLENVGKAIRLKESSVTRANEQLKDLELLKEVESIKLLCLIQVTFVGAKGDLKQRVPSFH
jgi:hypothetical protein